MIKINDSGFYLGYKKYEENSGIIFILSKKNGLIKSFTKFSKKSTKINEKRKFFNIKY